MKKRRKEVSRKGREGKFLLLIRKERRVDGEWTAEEEGTHEGEKEKRDGKDLLLIRKERREECERKG